MTTAKFDAPHETCPLCSGSLLVEVFVDDRGCRICRCRTCRVQFMNPPYTDSHLANYYAQYTRAEPQWEEPRVALQRFYLSLISRRTAPLQTLLDFGTGRGYMLQAAKERGIEAVGYDVDEEATREVARARGVSTFSGDFLTAPLEDDSFDVVVMHHVLEHLKQPAAYLDRVDRLLRRRGTLFVAVPNVASISIRTKALLERLRLRRAHLGRYYDTSHHLFYFTPSSLRDLLMRRGYDILLVRGCHRVRPGDSASRRWWNRNIYDVPTWRSGFLILARKAR